MTMPRRAPGEPARERVDLRRGAEPAVSAEDAADRDHLERARDQYDRGEMETVSMADLLADVPD